MLLHITSTSPAAEIISVQHFTCWRCGWTTHSLRLSHTQGTGKIGWIHTKAKLPLPSSYFNTAADNLSLTQRKPTNPEMKVWYKLGLLIVCLCTPVRLQFTSMHTQLGAQHYKRQTNISFKSCTQITQEQTRRAQLSSGVQTGLIGLFSAVLHFLYWLISPESCCLQPILNNMCSHCN